MTQTRLLLTALAVLTLTAAPAVAQTKPRAWSPPAAATSETEPREDDADMPEFAQDLVAKDEYVRMRQEYFESRLDVPASVAQAARLAAIRTMQRQASAQAPFAVYGSWTAIGPDPIPNGQTTSFPTAVSGRVTAIVVHPTDPDIAYVGAAQGGVYRTLDGGATWTAIFDQAASLAIGALALAPSDPTVLFVGTGESHGSCDSYFGVGLYRIENADTAPILHGPFDPPVLTGIAGTRAFTGRSISEILVHPTNPDIIFVSTTAGIGGLGCDVLSTFIPNVALRGLYRSFNAMSASPSFDKVKVSADGSVAPDASGNRNVTDMAMDPDDPATLMVWYSGATGVNNGGVFTTNNALDPVPVFTQRFASPANFIRGEVTVQKQGAGKKWLIAIGESASGTTCTSTTQLGSVRRSLDGGVTWSTKLGGGGFCGGQCFYDIAIAMPPGDTSTVLLGGAANGSCQKVYQRSTNGGVSFVQSDAGLHADVHAITVAPSNPDIVYLGCDGGVYRSTNRGQTWTSRNTAGFSATQFQGFDMHPLDPNFLIGGTQDNGTNWYKPDATWFRADFGDGGFAAIDQNALDNTNVTMFHTYFNQVGAMGYARVTTTASATDGNWQLFGCGFGGSTPNGFSCADGAVLFYAPLVRGPGNPSTLYYGSDRLYRSANAGVTMVVASQAPFQAGIPVSAIGIAPNNDAIRLVGLRNGRVFSTTTGASPLADVTGPLPARFVTRFAFDPVTPTTAYVTYAGFGLPAGQHIWKSTDITNPAAWTPAGAGIPDVPVNGITIDPMNPSNLYAATDIGVYASTDGGANWSPFMTGMPVVAGFEIRIHPVHRVLRVATHGRGIYERALDAPVATQLSLVGSEFVDGRARLTWFSSDGAGEQVRLYRRFVPGEFQPVAMLTVGGEGMVEYEDADLIPGQSYEYEVGVFDQGRERRLGRVWLDVPAGRVLALRAAAGRSGELRLALQLPTSEPASLELVDVTGRRVSEQPLAGLAAGDHEVVVGGDVRPGLYWARVHQAGKVVTAKVVHSR
jgi:photosystem II stability/assembly factor-like uncharacterized protein